MTVAVDTSVAVPLLVRSHHDHADVVRWWNGQEVALSADGLARAVELCRQRIASANEPSSRSSRVIPRRTSAAKGAAARRRT